MKNFISIIVLMATANSIAQISCTDILSDFAIKPTGLEYVKCESPKSGQTKLRATYRISGNISKDIENFLVDNYGMGELKCTCCGWDNAGNYGEFQHPQFKEIDKYCSAIISMYASAEMEDKSQPTGIRLETDRNKIKYFTVVVELVVI